jgi:hypothetical protein
LKGFRSSFKLCVCVSLSLCLFAGEFAAYITGANLIMEYLLSNAAVARSLTSYVASVFGVLGTNAWRVEIKHFPAGYNQLDFLAVTVVVTLTICLCFRYAVGVLRPLAQCAMASLLLFFFFLN